MKNITTDKIYKGTKRDQKSGKKKKTANPDKEK